MKASSPENFYKSVLFGEYFDKDLFLNHLFFNHPQ